MKNCSILLFLFFAILSCTQKKLDKAETKPIENPVYDKAYNFREAHQSDSAFKYFNEAKDVFIAQRDSIGTAKCLVNMAIISTNKGDYYGGQELSLNAKTYFNENDKGQYVYIKSNYNNLGIASSKLEDYEKGIIFYDQAIKFATDINDILLYLNNKANIYRELKQYNTAISLYNRVLQDKRLSKKEYARTLTNYSLAKWLQNPTYDPSLGYKEALKIRIALNDLEGQNSSYAHLAEYYAQIDPTLALDYAEQMYAIAQINQDPEDVLRALRKLVNLSKTNQTKQYFNQYQTLLDSIHKVRNANKNQFALIRYETEKHKADNLKLQKDNDQKNFYLILTLVFVVMGSVITIIWDRKRKQKIALEAQNLVQENHLRTSKKIHDVVANGLYRVMTEIENNVEIDKEIILDKIEDLYEKSRDISYDEMPHAKQNFDDKITSLLTSFATSTTKVFIAGNTANLWNNVDATVKYEVEHVLQELMVI